MAALLCLCGIVTTRPSAAVMAGRTRASRQSYGRILLGPNLGPNIGKSAALNCQQYFSRAGANLSKAKKNQQPRGTLRNYPTRAITAERDLQNRGLGVRVPPLLPHPGNSVAVSIGATVRTLRCDKRRFLFCPFSE